MCQLCLWEQVEILSSMECLSCLLAIYHVPLPTPSNTTQLWPIAMFFYTFVVNRCVCVDGKPRDGL